MESKGEVKVIVTVPQMDTTLQYTLDKCDSNMKLFVKRLENNAYLTAMSLQAI